jgi:hypothetical protein
MLSEDSTGPGENDGHVIGLFGAADPVRHRPSDHIGDVGEWLVAVLLDQFDQAFRTEFSGFVLWFGDAIAKCDEEIAWLHRDRGFVIGRTIKLWTSSQIALA